MIQLYCGDGKGKTTTAMGGVIRALGCGRRVLLTQYMKGNASGEIQWLLKQENVTILRSEEEFGFFHTLSNQEKEELTQIHNVIIRQVIEYIENTKELIFVVLDELTYPVEFGLIEEELVNQLFRLAQEESERVELVITGRDPKIEWVEQADYCSYIEKRKHPYDKGIGARLGIEF